MKNRFAAIAIVKISADNNIRRHFRREHAYKWILCAGELDSPISTKNWGRKEFVLRDRTDRMTFSYYEMDARMPYVNVGTTLKYVGLLALIFLAIIFVVIIYVVMNVIILIVICYRWC